MDPEPAYEVVAEPEGETAPADEMPKLQVAAKCAYGTLECETSSIAFRPTMMFQVRAPWTLSPRRYRLRTLSPCRYLF